MVFGKHINKYYLKYGPLLLLGLAALVLVDFAQLKLPEFFRTVVNGLNTGQVEYQGAEVPFTMDFLLDKVCLPVIFIIAMMVIGRFGWRIGFFGSSVRIEASLRDEMFDHAKDLSQEYYQVNKVGDLMSLFTNDLETIQDCFGNGALVACDCIFLGSLAFYKMFRMSPALALLSLIPMAGLLVLGLSVGRRMMNTWEERQGKFSKLSDFSQEAFMGLSVIKAFAKELKELHAFRKISKENEDVNVKFVRLETIFDVSIEIFVAVVICLILAYGGYLVYIGTFNAGQLIEFIGYFDAIIWPVLAISFLIDMTARGKASLKRVSKFLDQEIQVKDTEETAKKAESGEPVIPDFKGSIEFRHLSFTYPGSELEVLHDLCFKIEAGENIGLIGRTGAGKTAIVDLVARTYNVPRGTVFADGVDVLDIPIRELRSHIGYVPQDNFLFSDKISENIGFSFRDKADHMKEIVEASKRSGVYSDIQGFPKKFETVLGERGVTVSGGQKQRISIARALIKDAEILILDDSVSAVDTETEREILGHLKETRKGKTTILIAHRISTVEQMDKILFIEDGAVADFGAPKELEARCPAFAEMVRLQRLEDEKNAETMKMAEEGRSTQGEEAMA